MFAYVWHGTCVRRLYHTHSAGHVRLATTRVCCGGGRKFAVVVVAVAVQCDMALRRQGVKGKAISKSNNSQNGCVTMLCIISVLLQMRRNWLYWGSFAF